MKKRGPGRPRKTETAAAVVVKRGPGRPKKEETVKREPGRPRTRPWHAALHVGPTDKTTHEAAKIIMEILRSPRGDEAITAALRALENSTSVRYVTVQNCTFGGPQ